MYNLTSSKAIALHVKCPESFHYYSQAEKKGRPYYKWKIYGLLAWLILLGNGSHIYGNDVWLFLQFNVLRLQFGFTKLTTPPRTRSKLVLSVW